MLTVAILYSIFSTKTNEYDYLDDNYESESELGGELGTNKNAPKVPIRRKTVKKRTKVTPKAKVPKKSKVSTTVKVSKPSTSKKQPKKPTNNATSKKVKPKVQKPKVVKPKVQKPKSNENSDDGNKVSKTNVIKSSGEKVKGETTSNVGSKVNVTKVSPIKPKSKSKPTPDPKPKKEVKVNPKPDPKKIQGSVVNAPIVVTKDKKEEVDAKDVIKKKSKLIKQTINTSGFEFKGEFNEEELVLIKKFASMSQGQIIQTHLGKVIFNKWIKTKPKYEYLLEDLEGRSVEEGRYPTYLMWGGKVTKILLGGKVQ